MSRLVRKKDAWYYQPDEPKVWYRVYDGYFRSGRFYRFRPGSSRQPHRYFVPKEPSAFRRDYKFADTDNRQMTKALVDAQFAKTTYFAGPGRPEPHASDWQAKIPKDTPETVAEI